MFVRRILKLLHYFYEYYYYEDKVLFPDESWIPLAIRELRLFPHCHPQSDFDRSCCWRSRKLMLLSIQRLLMHIIAYLEDRNCEKRMVDWLLSKSAVTAVDRRSSPSLKWCAMNAWTRSWRQESNITVPCKCIHRLHGNNSEWAWFQEKDSCGWSGFFVKDYAVKKLFRSKSPQLLKLVCLPIIMFFLSFKEGTMSLLFYGYVLTGHRGVFTKPGAIWAGTIFQRKEIWCITKCTMKISYNNMRTKKNDSFIISAGSCDHFSWSVVERQLSLSHAEFALNPRSAGGVNITPPHPYFLDS